MESHAMPSSRRRRRPSRRSQRQPQPQRQRRGRRSPSASYRRGRCRRSNRSPSMERRNLPILLLLLLLLLLPGTLLACWGVMASSTRRGGGAMMANDAFVAGMRHHPPPPPHHHRDDHLDDHRDRIAGPLFPLRQRPQSRPPQSPSPRGPILNSLLTRCRTASPPPSSWSSTARHLIFSKSRSSGANGIKKKANGASSAPALASGAASAAKKRFGKLTTSTMMTTTMTKKKSPRGEEFTHGRKKRGAVEEMGKMPFIIERIPDASTNSKVFEEIAEMCIPVFFNQQAEQGAMTLPWKGLQLGYLQNMQASDLRLRRNWGREPNVMFVARRVLPMKDPSVAGTTPLILDKSRIFNFEELQKESSSSSSPPPRSSTSSRPFMARNMAIMSKSKRVPPSSSSSSVRTPARTTVPFDVRSILIQGVEKDEGRAYHKEDQSHEDEDDYVPGEVIGFCEVTEKPYGMLTTSTSETKRRWASSSSSSPTAQEKENDETSSSSSSAERKKKGRVGGGASVRPVLANLSVKASARKSGIGTALMDACERATRRDFASGSEIVLEVEDDNPRALEFYLQRGYQIVFEDPACRRFDTSGLILTKERCTKITMRKDLSSSFSSSSSSSRQNRRITNGLEPSSPSSATLELSKFFQSLRDKVLS